MALTPEQRKFVIKFFSSFPGNKEEEFFELAKQRLVAMGGDINEAPKGTDVPERVNKANPYMQSDFDDPVPPMIVQHTDKSNKPTPDIKRGVPFKEGETLPVINKVQVKTGRAKKSATDIKVEVDK